MGALFSWNKRAAEPQRQSKVTAQDRAVLDLKIARDKAQRYKKKLTQDAAKYTAAAKRAMVAKKKNKALTFLKMRKLNQKQLDKVDASLLNLHEMVETIEWETQQVEFLNGLKAGTDALKQIHQTMSLEEAEKIMDDSADAVAYQNQMDELLGANLTAEDDEAALRELAAIEAEQADAAGLSMPEAPSTALPSTGLGAGAGAGVAAAPAPAAAEEAAEEAAPERVLVEA